MQIHLQRSVSRLLPPRNVDLIVGTTSVMLGQHPHNITSTSVCTGWCPADTIRWINVVLMLIHRVRRWTNVKTTLIQRLVSPGWLPFQIVVCDSCDFDGNQLTMWWRNTRNCLRAGIPGVNNIGQCKENSINPWSAKYSYKNLEDQRVYFNLISSQMSYSALPDSFEYLCHASTTIRNILLYSVGIDFSRQNLTFTDVRFWRLKSILAL